MAAPPDPHAAEGNGRAVRLQLIEQIEKARGSRLVAMIWGDRQKHETQIAPDAHRVLFQHLERIGPTEKIDVLIYSSGGQTLAAGGLANLVREFCNSVGVLVPHRALSAATLFTLSADEIVRSRLGQLSPIDPSITSALGPKVQVPGQPGPRVVPISVEDVVGFLDLAREEADLHDEQSLAQVFLQLATQVHPLAVGAVYRTREQIKVLAERLLSLHMGGDDHAAERTRIVSDLTRELGSHDYLIGRTEARARLKLNVIDAPGNLENDMLALFRQYSDLLELDVPYNQEGILGANAEITADFNRGVFESAELTHFFRTTKNLKRVQVPGPGGIPTPGMQEIVSFEGWVVDGAL